jgi:hypothetical protein
MVSNSVVHIILKILTFLFFVPFHEVTICDKFSRLYDIAMRMTSYIETLDPLARF